MWLPDALDNRANKRSTKKLKRENWEMRCPERALKSSDMNLGIEMAIHFQDCAHAQE